MARFFKPKSDGRGGREILLRVSIGHHPSAKRLSATQAAIHPGEYPADFGGLVDEALAATEIRIGGRSQLSIMVQCRDQGTNEAQVER
jgi:hypothetical protein